MNGPIARLEGALANIAAGAWRLLGARAGANARDLVAARFGGALVVVPLLALLSAALLLSDLVVINTYIVDYTLPLDTSLRWAYGQVPHLDYHTPIGAAYWLMQGLAVEVGGLGAKSPVIANFLAAVPLALCALLLARPRLSGGLVGLLLVAVVALVISPRSTGDLPGQISFLGAYNKVALASLAILLVALFVAPRTPRRGARLAVEAVAVAFLLTWMIYLKVSFAAIAVAGGAVALHYAPANRRLTLLAWALCAMAVAAVGLGSDLNRAYLADLAQASASVPMVRPLKIFQDIIEGLPVLAIVALALVGYWRRSPAPGAAKLSNVVLCVGLLAAAALAMNQVHDHAWPLAFAVLIVLAQRALAESGDGFVAPTVAALVLVAYTLFADGISTIVYVNGQREGAVLRYCDDPARPACAIGMATFEDWVRPRLTPLPTAADTVADQRSLAELYRTCESDEYCVWWMLQHQLYRQLNSIVEPGDRPLFLGFMNILPYYYGLEPPRRVLAWMDIDRNVSLAAHPEPKQMLSDATLLVMPRIRSDVGYFADLETIYGAAIEELFDEVARSEAWSIWRRRPES